MKSEQDIKRVISLLRAHMQGCVAGNDRESYDELFPIWQSLKWALGEKDKTTESLDRLLRGLASMAEEDSIQ